MLQEIVKHLGRPLDLACKLIENILDAPTQKIGEILGDQVSYWQWGNRLSIADKAARKIESRSLSPRKLPMDFTVPFLRESGDAADAKLQDWWSELLTSAVADDAYAHIAFVDVLHSMSRRDAQFLEALLRTGHVGWDGRIEAVVRDSGLTQEQALMSFHNLDRLGLFSPTGKRLKGFASDFLTACTGDGDMVRAYFEKQKQVPHRPVAD